MLTILGLMTALALPQPLDAPADPDRIVLVQDLAADQQVWEVLDLQALMPILQQEALRDARRMVEEGQVTGAEWPDLVARIHQPDRLEALFREGLRPALEGVDRSRLETALSFHRSDLGRRVLRLEASARQAMLDQDVDEAARAAVLQAADDARITRIRGLIEGADLIGPNVAGGLNAVVAFSRGFADGGGYAMPPDPREILQEAWSQRDQIEAETVEWLQAFLLLAYGPLTDGELDTYAQFAASEDGQLMSRLLFAGFDRMFGQTSYDMGLAIASRGQGQPL